MGRVCKLCKDVPKWLRFLDSSKVYTFIYIPFRCSICWLGSLYCSSSEPKGKGCKNIQLLLFCPSGCSDDCSDFRFSVDFQQGIRSDELPIDIIGNKKHPKLADGSTLCNMAGSYSEYLHLLYWSNDVDI